LRVIFSFFFCNQLRICSSFSSVDEAWSPLTTSLFSWCCLHLMFSHTWICGSIWFLVFYSVSNLLHPIPHFSFISLTKFRNGPDWEILFRNQQRLRKYFGCVESIWTVLHLLWDLKRIWFFYFPVKLWNICGAMKWLWNLFDLVMRFVNRVENIFCIKMYKF
jgi:hypothetical protein